VVRPLYGGVDEFLKKLVRTPAKLPAGFVPTRAERLTERESRRSGPDVASSRATKSYQAFIECGRAQLVLCIEMEP